MTKQTLQFLGVNTARFLKYVWSFFNIMHESVNYPVKIKGKTMRLWEYRNDSQEKKCSRLTILQQFIMCIQDPVKWLR